MTTDETAEEAAGTPSRSTANKQRLGLALSGGGFRASLFHIGVLARMAEIGLLRHIEAISTVSGGSIIGALYYIHVKKLLESRADKEIEDEQFAELVETLGREFLLAVQKNLRLLTFANPLKNMKMALPSYSRSDRIGELFDEHLYRPAFDVALRRPVKMRELKIRPLDVPQGDDFNPTHPGHNDDRRAKVPILILNATTLNTGHDWRFLASRMGEPRLDDPNAEDIDKNSRLLSGDYDTIASHQRDFPLGIAVAASAGVPGLFPPTAVSGLYEGWRVQLVDGGIYDNQGIAGLTDSAYKCTDFVISDASGQLDDEPEPATTALAVLGHVTNILMGRVREEMVGGLIAEHGRDHVAFQHLTRGLAAPEKPFIKAEGEGPGSERVDAVPYASRTGVDPEVQKLLSHIRTDLDSFTDAEAYALMVDGYLLSAQELERIATHYRTRPVKQRDWDFLKVSERVRDPKQDKAFLKQLKVAAARVGKPFRLGITAGLALACALALALWSAYFGLLWWLVDLVYPGWLAWLWTEVEGCIVDFRSLLTIALTLLGVFGLEWLGRIFKVLGVLRYPWRVVRGAIIRFVLPALGAFPVYVYLKTIDRYYVKQGRVS